ncbi:F-box protein At4g22390-like [Punica granatum]|uniref:F-box protein At4g22390-like n=1 Tax=Punica granatum TaxID=22663 RepID=A0A6P8EFT3_PUNGR|nr:F-box protein At4g22390-like [Punica granatum]
MHFDVIIRVLYISFLFYRTNEVYIVEVYKHWNRVLIKLVDSLNCIICLYTYHRDDSGACRIFLGNPTINDLFTLPRPPCPVPKYLGGFGFNPLSGHLDDFKVICINLHFEYKDRERKRHSQVEVYSLRTNSWKQLGDCCPSYLTSHLVNKQPVISLFDVAKEEFHEMTPPNSMPSDGNHIGLVGSCLSPLAHNPSEGYEVWTMRELRKLVSWTKLYEIEFPSYISFYDKDTGRFSENLRFPVDSIYGNRLVAHAKSLISPSYSARV